MENMKVNFYDSVEDKFLKFAVIIAKYNGKYVFCKHKERDTYEIPDKLTYPEIQPKLMEEAKKRNIL
ncbi:NUDIX hydrolase [Inconstantimicrobium porci]|nr:DNA mismatch repair protein MutT [Inconstantimicrobium porci]